MAINLPNSPSNGQTVTLADKTLVYNSTSGTWNIQTADSSGGSLSISDTAPSSPSDGDMWFDSSTLTLYAYYDDGDSQQWIDLAGQATTLQATSSDTAPANPSTGALWFDTANLNLFVYYSDGSSNQWVQMNSEAPAIPEDLSDLTDTTNLLFDGQYSSLTGAPTSSTAGALGTLTKTFTQNEEAEITLSENISPVPNVSVFKEVPQGGLSSKGNWDVNANATNYEFFDEKPISYASTTLTPSATGDGTFDSSNPISRRHIPASTAATTYTTYGAGFSGGMFGFGLYDWGGALLSDDGTKFWMVAKNKGTNSDEAHIYAWTLSTPFRVDTAAAVGSTAIKVITEMSNITALLFNNDGTKIVCANGNNFYQFDLSTAYDLSTMGSGTESNWRIDLQRDPLYIDWSGSGDKLIVTEAWTTGGHSTRVRVFDLNTPYDITTMANLPVGTTTSFDANNPYYSIYSSNIYQKGWKISQDGLKFYAIDVLGKTLTKELPSPWVMKTGSVTTGDQGSIGDNNNWQIAAEDDYDLITGNYYNVSWTQNGSAIILFNSAIAPNYLDIIPLPATQVFPSTDVGKKVVGNSGSAIITASSGTYQSVTAFADTSAISSWQLFGAEGKADGSGIELTGLETSFDWLGHDNATPFSTRNGSFPGWGLSDDAGDYQRHCLSPNGDYYYMYSQYAPNNYPIFKWELTTPYDLSTMSYVGNYAWSYYNNTKQMMFSPDGNQFITNNSTYHYIRWQTAVNGNYSGADTQSSASSTTGSRTFHYGAYISDKSANAEWWFWINEAGTKLFVGESWYDKMYSWDITTAWDLSTVDVSSQVNYAANAQIGDMLFVFKNDGTEFLTHNKLYQNFPTPYNSTSALTVTPTTSIYNGTLQYVSLDQKTYLTGDNNANVSIYTDLGLTAKPWPIYSPVLTGSTGQINSSAWVDLDSMVADETKNDGDVFYAVSTDDRTSWGVIKDGDGVRKIVKNNSGTWQYNNNAGSSVTAYYDIANAVYDSVSYTPSNPVFSSVMAVGFSADGTKMYTIVQGAPWQHELSTAFDISTASSIGYNYSSDLPEGNARLITFNPTGTKMYIGGIVDDTIYQYSLSNAFDLAGTSVSRDTSKTFTITNASGVSTVNLNGMIFNNNGTKMYVINNDRIEQYSLSTAYDISTASYDSINFVVTSQETVANDIKFNSDGTKLFLVGNGSDAVQQYSLSTAYDLSTISYDSISFSVLGNVSNARSLNFNNDGSKMYVSTLSGGTVYQYTTSGTNIAYDTSETWVNGTNNNEHATLQEALGAQSFNRMDKAQLQAVTDPNHYVLGDTLDLMIAPYAASGTSPLSDGVTIGYQADALIKQAINGTDYEAEFPATNKVKIKSLAAQNLKIRII